MIIKFFFLINWLNWSNWLVNVRVEWIVFVMWDERVRVIQIERDWWQ